MQSNITVIGKKSNAADLPIVRYAPCMGLERKDTNGYDGTVEFLTPALAQHTRAGANC